MNNKTTTPSNIAIQVNESETVMIYRRLNIYVYKLACGCLMWDVFIFWFIFKFVVHSSFNFSWLLAPIVIITIIFNYIMGIRIFGKTVISLKQNMVCVTETPSLKISNNKKCIRFEEIAKVFVETGSGTMQPRFCANLKVIDRCGASTTLVSNMTSVIQAEFIRKRVEERLRER